MLRVLPQNRKEKKGKEGRGVWREGREGIWEGKKRG